MPVYKIRPGNLWIDWLRMTVHSRYLLDVLQPLRDRLRESDKMFSDAERSGDPEWLEAFTDDECENIENVLGISFVVCQTYLDSVAQHLVKIHESNEKALKSAKPEIKAQAAKLAPALAKLPRNKSDMVRLGDHVSRKIKISKAEAIHQVANYFKHKDEWPLDWSKLPKRSERTRDVIEQLGLTPNSSGNFRTAAEMLGNSDYNQLHVFEDIVTSWGEQLLKQLSNALAKVK